MKKPLWDQTFKPWKSIFPLSFFLRFFFFFFHFHSRKKKKTNPAKRNRTLALGLRKRLLSFHAILDSNDALMLPALPLFCFVFLHLTYLRRKSWLVSCCYPQIQGFTFRWLQANCLFWQEKELSLLSFLRAFLVRLMGSLSSNLFFSTWYSFLWRLFNVL